MAAAKAGDTVTLIADCTADATKTSTDDRLVVTKDITIDFGAYTLSVPGELEPTDNWSALFIEANVTVKGTTGGINCLDKDDPNDRPGPYVFTVRNGGTLTIESGVYHGGGTVVTVNANGKAVITGGTFTATPFNEPHGMGFVLNCHDASYAAGIASIEVKGGSFTGFNPADCAAEGAGTNFVAFGYKATETSTGVWTVAKKPTADPEAEKTIDIDPTASEEAQQAQADAIAEDTVVTPPNDVAAVVDAVAYDGYFTKTAVKQDEVWVVQTELNEEVVFPAEEADDLTADLADVLDVAAETPVEITTAKPGLYYSIEAATDLGFTEPEEGARTLATGTTVSPKKPAVTGTPTAVFYRVKVSTMPNSNN